QDETHQDETHQDETHQDETQSAGMALVGERAGSPIGARLTQRQIERIVDRIENQWIASRSVDAELSGTMVVGGTRAISPHSSRHRPALGRLEGNAAAGRPPASVEHVRGWLGHFDIRTTQGYLAHLDARRHRRPLTIAPDMARTPAATNPPAEQPAVESEESTSEE